MASPRIHDVLEELFRTKDLSHLSALLSHPHLNIFKELHHLNIPSEILLRAFTHSSFKHEFQVPDQEVLEFLGDAVLDLILTERLVEKFPLEKEGQLSKLRSALVNEKTLATLARQLELQRFILVGKGEYSKGTHEQDVVLADTFEALLGVIYQCEGLRKVKEFYFKELDLFDKNALSLERIKNFDSKSKLQELSLKKYKKLPKYVSKDVDGKFEIQLWINDELKLSGIFSSKKEGEKSLAEKLLKNETL